MSLRTPDHSTANAPTIYLACSGSWPCIPPPGEKEKPALLVSYADPYLKTFMRNRQRGRFVYREWVMDSGAFSAANKGAHIDLATYIVHCRQLLEQDPDHQWVFALDVIGDWRASLKNTEVMWRSGIEAVPAFHYGEPWDVLVGLARDYPKIAIGGAVGVHRKAKREWARQCFARVWPAKIHGFGMIDRDMLLELPFHSADASNWEFIPASSGEYKGFNGPGSSTSRNQLSVRGQNVRLDMEVGYYLRQERETRSRWRQTWATFPQR